MVIVDTTVWVDYLQGIRNPETDWRHAELDRQRLGVTDVILCEVLQGVRDEIAVKNVERQLLKLEVFESGGVDLAREGHPERSDAAQPRPYCPENNRLSRFCIRERHSLLHPRPRFRSVRNPS